MCVCVSTRYRKGLNFPTFHLLLIAKSSFSNGRRQILERSQKPFSLSFSFTMFLFHHFMLTSLMGKNSSNNGNLFRESALKTREKVWKVKFASTCKSKLPILPFTHKCKCEVWAGIALINTSITCRKIHVYISTACICTMYSWLDCQTSSNFRLVLWPL